MKLLHQSNLYCWTQFDEDRDIDFHSYLWVRDEGNVIFDPLPLTAHDEHHLKSLGSVSHIIISNSDHIRSAKVLAQQTGADIWGPAGEKSSFPINCTQWLSEGNNVIDGLDVYALNGSKTEGELAFIVEGKTLITGDLIRAHSGGKLCMIPDAKLQDVEQAKASVKRVASIKGIDAILTGDGWPVFRNGEQALLELIASI
ncbi:MBL fold metallo-hydrolase [Amphritea sp.]|uniref:MBL fold metallo-hydrolase n=1 Tax=Amphritea sp. TaxID=1872502 RepID=UPI0025C5C416|nr:MBL fold metallo-hydrolase [Amphritea sp.]